MGSGSDAEGSEGDRLAEAAEVLGKRADQARPLGLTIEEAAHVLGISKPTAERRWRVARMWLRSELQAEEAGEL